MRGFDEPWTLAANARRLWLILEKQTRALTADEARELGRLQGLAGRKREAQSSPQAGGTAKDSGPFREAPPVIANRFLARTPGRRRWT